MQYVSFVTKDAREKQHIMLVHVLREYNINKILLSHLGLWPFQRKLERNLISTLCLVVQISYYAFVILLYDYRNNENMMFESSCQFIISTFLIVKLWNGIWNRDKFRRICEAMDNHWKIFTDDSEIRILKDYSILSRKFTIFYATTLYFSTVLFLVIPLRPAILNISLPFNESRLQMLPFKLEFRVDVEKYFVPIFYYLVVANVGGIIILVGVDTMHFTCYTHACSLFSIIGEQFGNITFTPDRGKCGYYLNNEFNSLNEQGMYQEYIICIKKYQLALKFVDILHSACQTATVFTLLLAVVSISVMGIRIIHVLNQLQDVIRYNFITIGMLFQLLLICYSGQKLMDESQNVFHRAYGAEWYQFSPKLKSLLILTLHRSFTPCGLSTNTVIPVSMTTCATAIRLAASYFTTFLSLKD